MLVIYCISSNLDPRLWLSCFKLALYNELGTAFKNSWCVAFGQKPMVQAAIDRVSSEAFVMLVVSLKGAKNTVPRVELISQIRLLQLSMHSLCRLDI